MAMNRLVQWGVVLGCWWIALIDALGNYAGQDHYPAWVPIIWATTLVLALAHGAAAVDLSRGRA